MAQSCCNPFDIPGHSWRSRQKKLQPTTALMCEKAPEITVGFKICDTCRIKLSKKSAEPDISQSEAEEEYVVEKGESVASLNMCLADIGETPYSHDKGRGKKYQQEKVKRIAQKH